MHLNTYINTVYCQNVLLCSALSSWLFIEIFYCLILKSWYHLIRGESISGQNSLWRWEFHYLCWGTRAWSNTDTAALQTAPSDKQKWKGEKRLRHWINKFNQQTWSEEKRFLCVFLCWYLRQCSSLAAFHWQERRQQRKQVPAREVMTADKRWRGIYIQPMNIHHR